MGHPVFAGREVWLRSKRPGAEAPSRLGAGYRALKGAATPESRSPSHPSEQTRRGPRLREWKTKTGPDPHSCAMRMNGAPTMARLAPCPTAPQYEAFPVVSV